MLWNYKWKEGNGNLPIAKYWQPWSPRRQGARRALQRGARPRGIKRCARDRKDGHWKKVVSVRLAGSLLARSLVVWSRLCVLIESAFNKTTPQAAAENCWTVRFQGSKCASHFLIPNSRLFISCKRNERKAKRKNRRSKQAGRKGKQGNRSEVERRKRSEEIEIK